jgi:hypothetical protein
LATTPAEYPGVPPVLLRQAVELYLAHAYPTGELPEAVRRRLSWFGTEADRLELDRPPFERANRPEPGVASIVALRLGNDHFPHMKLQIQPWPNEMGFLLTVNTHDQVLSLSSGGPEAEAARALQAHNQQLKEAIELAWDEAGLPTFLRYLRDYLTGREPDPGPSQDPLAAS